MKKEVPYWSLIITGVLVAIVLAIMLPLYFMEKNKRTTCDSDLKAETTLLTACRKTDTGLQTQYSLCTTNLAACQTARDGCTTAKAVVQAKYNKVVPGVCQPNGGNNPVKLTGYDMIASGSCGPVLGYRGYNEAPQASTTSTTEDNLMECGKKCTADTNCNFFNFNYETKRCDRMLAAAGCTITGVLNIATYRKVGQTITCPNWPAPQVQT
jgi:hypothetical protein